MKPVFICLSNRLVHIVDWFPTLLSLGGNSEPGPVDGVDIWPLLTRDREVRSEAVINIDLDDQSETFQIGLRSGDFKLIWGQTKEFKQHSKRNPAVHLFDLKKDPYEKRDLAQTEPEKLAEMKERAIALTKDAKVGFHPTGFSLGYPRYHKGLLEPGWCSLGWWNILWKNPLNVDYLKHY